MTVKEMEPVRATRQEGRLLKTTRFLGIARMLPVPDRRASRAFFVCLVRRDSRQEGRNRRKAGKEFRI